MLTVTPRYYYYYHHHHYCYHSTDNDDDDTESHNIKFYLFFFFFLFTISSICHNLCQTQITWFYDVKGQFNYCFDRAETALILSFYIS